MSLFLSIACALANRSTCAHLLLHEHRRWDGHPGEGRSLAQKPGRHRGLRHGGMGPVGRKEYGETRKEAQRWPLTTCRRSRLTWRRRWEKGSILMLTRAEYFTSNLMTSLRAAAANLNFESEEHTCQRFVSRDLVFRVERGLGELRRESSRQHNKLCSRSGIPSAFARRPTVSRLA
jgi:hypothetical protein